MEQLKMHAIDYAKENVQKVAQLFPNCVTETANGLAIDFEKLQQELSEEVMSGSEERYQFTWPGKRAAIREANSPCYLTLRPSREDSVDFDKTKNLYIEGDNLQVLKLLRESYLGKVKMIYIDPPYNTGNDFVYNDDFSQSAADYKSQSDMFDEEGNMLLQNYEVNSEASGRYHSDWLNMMYPRLKVAKDLLTEDGVIFISIDDNEVNNLHKICDEIFGEGNLINTICINMNSLSGVKMTHVIKGKRFPAQKEYLLIYKKGGIQPILSIEKRPKEQWDKEYNMIIPELSEQQFDAFENMNDVEINDTLKDMHLISLAEYAKRQNIELSDDWKFANAYRIFGTKSNRSLAKKVACQTFCQQIYGYTNTDGNKRYFRTDFNKETKDPRIELVQAKSTLEVFISDNWTDISNDGGVAQEGDVIYPNGKKPLQLLNRIIKTANSKDCIVMDFFAGSSTTAHSVFIQNTLDKGTRRFIMVQLPENLDVNLQEATGDEKEDIESLIEFCDSINKPHNICELGKERIRRAGKKIKEEAGEAAKDLDTGFRVLKLASSNMNDVFYNPQETELKKLFAENIKPDRTPEDLLFQVLPELNLPLSAKIETKTIAGKQVFVVEDNYLAACFDEDITDECIMAIAKTQPYHFVMRESGAHTDQVLDNFDQLFKAYSPKTTTHVM